MSEQPNDQPQEGEPAVFDLEAYLERQRQRAVGKPNALRQAGSRATMRQPSPLGDPPKPAA